MKATHHNVPPEAAAPDPSGADGILKCGDIQELLSAYMMRELGDTQSRIVREHLRTCEDCRREAADLQSMLATLKAGADEESPAAERLSDDRRARIVRAVLHPVLDWMFVHHRLVSAAAAVLALAVVLFALRHAAIFRRQKLDEGIPVWRMFRSGRLPELVEQARERYAREAADEPAPETPGDANPREPTESGGAE